MLLGTTLAGKTTLMQLMAGLERPTSGEIWFGGKNVTGVPVQKRNVVDGLPAVHQLPEFHGLREHRLAAARRRHAPTREIERARRQGRRAAAPDADAAAPAERALRRPAAAHRDRPRPGQGLRPHPARRAARQSRLQAARGTARRAAEALRRPRTASSSMPRPSRPRRCSSAATPRRCIEGRVTQFGPTARDLSPARRPDHRPGLLRSADQHRARSTKRGGEILHRRRRSAGRAGKAARSDSRRRLHDRHPAASHHAAAQRRRRRRRSRAACWSPSSPARKASSTSTSTARPGCRSRTASTPSRSARRRKLYVDVDQSFFFDADGRLVAGGD